jgi:hypothetical protein
VRDTLTRRLLPRAVVALSRVDWPARAGARLRRLAGRRGRVELFFAFDDPCSAVAVIDLARRVSSRDVQLLLKPVVARGIEGDQAVELKRRYALVDARRRARRAGLELERTEPVKATDTAFLAEWAAAATPGPALTSFCVEALTKLWFEPSPPPSPADYAPLWHARFADEPSPGDVRRNERLMRRRKPYDTPAAWIHGQWFFAHDRPVQIGERLDALGWTA